MSENMSSVAGALFFLSLSIASYLSSLIVNVIHSVTGENGKFPWLGGHDLNENRFEYYYFIVAALGSTYLIYYTFFASSYVSSTKSIKLGKELHLENSVGSPATRKHEERGGLDSGAT